MFAGTCAMTIHYEEKIDLFEAFAVSGQTITFYNENEPIEQYAQKKAAFMKVWEKLKRSADAALVELWVDEHGHHRATYLGRVCFVCSYFGLAYHHHNAGA